MAVDALGDGLGAEPVRHSNALRTWTGADLADVQAGWATHLARSEPSVLIPCCDDAVEALADHRDLFVGLGHRLPPGEDEVRRTMLDKVSTAAVAHRAGVLAPKVRIVREQSELVRAAEEIGYPCGLKPVQSHRFTRANGGLKGVTVPDPTALASLGARLLRSGLDIVVTELIPGRDPTFCSFNTYIDDDGRPLFEITKEKVRQHPVDFGLGTFHRTVWLPEVADMGRRFILESGLRGFGNVEFRTDARDGELKLIECNVRLTAANELLTRAGCDVAFIIYQRSLGNPVEPVDGFREGLRMFSPLKDARAVVDYRRRKELRWRDWVGDVVPPPGLPLFSWSDPQPSLRAGARKVSNALRRMRAGGAGGGP
ncbi:MAG: hypothetical protein ABIP36_06550 [Acidimicrobiales bacterium]